MKQDQMDFREAVEAALDKRKFLLYRFYKRKHDPDSHDDVVEKKHCTVNMTMPDRNISKITDEKQMQEQKVTADNEVNGCYKTMDDVRTKKYKCNLCEKTFIHPISLHEHKRYACKNGKRNPDVNISVPIVEECCQRLIMIVIGIKDAHHHPSQRTPVNEPCRRRLKKE